MIRILTGIPFDWAGEGTALSPADIGWVTVTDTNVETWTTPAADKTIWEQLTVTTVQDDVDFVLSASSQYPMTVSAETWEAVSVLSSVISEP